MVTGSPLYLRSSIQDFIDHTETITGDLDRPLDDFPEVKFVIAKQQTFETDLPKRSETVMTEKNPFDTVDQNITRPLQSSSTHYKNPLVASRLDQSYLSEYCHHSIIRPVRWAELAAQS